MKHAKYIPFLISAVPILMVLTIINMSAMIAGRLIRMLSDFFFHIVVLSSKAVHDFADYGDKLFERNQNERR